MKVENKIRLIAFIISIFIFCFVYFTVNFILTNITLSEKVNYADWISAGCNVVMAIAALGGFWIAKDWKKTSVREKVISHALDLKVNNLKKLSSALFSLSLWIEDINKIHADNHSGQDSLAFTKFRLNELYSRLKEKTNLLDSTLNEFLANKSKVEALGYSFKDKNGISLDNIYNDLFLLNSQAFSFQSAILSLAMSIDVDSPGREVFINDDLLNKVTELNSGIEVLKLKFIRFNYSNDSVLNSIEYVG